MEIAARASFLLRCGCCAEAVTHAQEKQDPEEQRERLARVVGRSRRRRVPLPGLDSPLVQKATVECAGEEGVTMRPYHFQCGFSA